MKTSRILINIFLGVALSIMPVLVTAKEQLRSGDIFQAQGVLQEVITKGSGSVMIDNVIYKLASHAKIREAGNPVKLRHLDLGLDVQFSYEKSKKSERAPVITSITVIMK